MSDETRENLLSPPYLEGPRDLDLPFCEEHRAWTVCTNQHCEKLHICRLYLNHSCPITRQDCPWGHQVKSDWNFNVLSDRGLTQNSEGDLRSHVAQLMREKDPVVDQEYWCLLAICDKYVANEACDEARCYKLHVCPRILEDQPCNCTAVKHNVDLKEGKNSNKLLLLHCLRMHKDELIGLLKSNASGNLRSTSQRSMTRSSPSQDPWDHPSSSQEPLDLPSPSQRTVDLPSPSPRTLDLPSLPQRTVDLPPPSQRTLDLPSPTQTTLDLPSSSQRTSGSPSQEPLNPPSPSQRTLDLPSPSQRTLSCSFPSQSTSGHPSQEPLDLPSTSQRTSNRPTTSRRQPVRASMHSETQATRSRTHRLGRVRQASRAGVCRCRMCKNRQSGCTEKNTVYQITCRKCEPEIVVHRGESKRTMKERFYYNTKHLERGTADGAGHLRPLQRHINECHVNEQLNYRNFRIKKLFRHEDKQERLRYLRQIIENRAIGNRVQLSHE